MELVDRYLKTVSSYLPAGQRDDIIKEFSENLHSEIEDKEAEFGRPLSEAEREAILKQHGHPLLVAGRYRQDHRSLAFGRQWIGPVLFPFYSKVLAFNLGISFTVVFTVFVALFAVGRSVTFSDVASAFLLQLVIQFGIVTLVFSIADKHLTNHPDRWDPRKPQQLRYPGFLEGHPSKNAQRVSRLESISQIIASAVFLGWLRAAQKSPFLIFGPAAAFFRLAPVWHQVYPPYALVIIAAMVQAGINLIHPDWVRFRSAVRAGMSAAVLVGVYFLLKAQEWVVLASPAANASGNHRHAMEIINKSVYWSVLLAGLIATVLLLVDFWRLVRPPQRQAAARV
jgi:hypothetical protein